MALSVLSLIPQIEVLETYEWDGKTYDLKPLDLLSTEINLKALEIRKKIGEVYESVLGEAGAKALYATDQDGETVERISRATGKSAASVGIAFEQASHESVEHQREYLEAVLDAGEAAFVEMPPVYVKAFYNSVQSYLNEYQLEKNELAKTKKEKGKGQADRSNGKIEAA